MSPTEQKSRRDLFKMSERFTLHGSVRMGMLRDIQDELSAFIRDSNVDDDNSIVHIQDGGEECEDDGIRNALGNKKASLKSLIKFAELIEQTPPNRDGSAVENGSTETANAADVDADVADLENPEDKAPLLEATITYRMGEKSTNKEDPPSDNKTTHERKASLMSRSVKKSVLGTFRKSMAVGNAVNYGFLEKKDGKYENGMLPKTKWWHGFFIFSVISFLACIITLWAPYPTGARMPTALVASMPWSDGCKGGLQSCICPRETICADDRISMAFLTIARCSAWADYPLYMVLFLSKADNLNNFLQRTALRVRMNFSDYHHVHTTFGIVVGIEATSHAFFHLLRWGRRHDDIRLLWESQTGVTGLIAFILGLFIIVPMSVPAVKNRVKFEWRKGLHYLFIVWALCLMFHAPQRIFWLIGIPFVIYLLDSAVDFFFKTYLIENAYFERISDGACLLTFNNPEGFSNLNAAYVYVMLPWISKNQNHAFTVFPGKDPNTSQICISSVRREGEWTTDLLKKIVIPAHRPAYITGPYVSPFSSPAMDCENLVIVGSGIGITPAISIFKPYVSTQRRVNLVWMCKDAGLVEHFVSNTLSYFGGLGYVLIYYTGKRPVVLEEELPVNVLIFNGRPNLEKTISGLIYSIASGTALPEEMADDMNILSRAPSAEARSKLLIEKALSLYSIDQLYQYAMVASGEGWGGMASYEGIQYVMRKLLGGDIAEGKITDVLEKVDPARSGVIGPAKFELLLNELKEGDEERPSVSLRREKTLRRLRRTSHMFDGAISTRRLEQSVTGGFDDTVKEFLHCPDCEKFGAKSWSMLYCGGSEAILSQLKDYKRKFGIGLAVEKFDW